MLYKDIEKLDKAVSDVRFDGDGADFADLVVWFPIVAIVVIYCGFFYWVSKIWNYKLIKSS